MASALSVLGNLSSLVGLGISIWILCRVRGMQRHYLFRARFPELRKRMRRVSSRISKVLNIYPSSEFDVRIELEKCRALLNTLKHKADRALRGTIEALAKEVAAICEARETPSKASVRAVYFRLVELEEEFDNVGEDLKWRSES